MLAIGFAPLFGGPGYESSLAAGIVLALIVPSSAAYRAVTGAGGPLAAVGDGVARGALLGTLAWGTTLVHGLRVGFCSLGGGTLLFALGPMSGALLGGALGAVVGRFARSRGWSPRRAGMLALVLPIASIGLSVGRFFTSPMVFAFDPLVGHFSGTLYDTVVDAVDRLAIYRLGTLASLVAIAAIAACFERRSAWRLVIASLAALASIVHVASGAKLGHWQTSATIRAELGGESHGARCTVIHPRAMRDADVRLFVRDCDADVDAVADWLGVPSPPRITAFLFADAAQKRRLMGAGDVYIAKPWRTEVYVQPSGYPHPVLAHEIAHVLAGSFARGPFRVAGRLGGLLPDPGLIEGIAVAAAPEDDELSPEAWSRAMLDLGILPRARDVFSLGFLFHDASRAYTVAGAFVTFVRAEHGAAAIRRWYGGESLEAVTGRNMDALDDAFRAHVKSLPIPEVALAIAKARFDRPGVFARRCPHEVDADRQRAMTLLGTGDVRGALAALRDLVRREPTDAGARLGLATCEERAGDDPSATLGGVLDDARMSRTVRDRAEERLGDGALGRGELAEARRRYDAVAARVLDEDHLRTLDVKRAATTDPAATAAITALLVGPPRTGPDALRAHEELGRWATLAPNDPLPRYLLARQSIARGDHAHGAALLDEALSLANALPTVHREAARMRLVAACALGDRDGVNRGLAAWTASVRMPGNRDALVRALAARCVP